MEIYREKGKHCGFTDLIFYKGFYYLCFRIGEKHMFSKSSILVLSSKNGTKWFKFSESITMQDLRDPRFIVLNGKLKILINYQRIKNNKVFQQTLLLWDLKNRYKSILFDAFVTYVKKEKVFCYSAVTNGKNCIINLKEKRRYQLPYFFDSTEGAFTYFQDGKGKKLIGLVRRDFNDSYLIIINAKPIKNPEKISIVFLNHKLHCPIFFKWGKKDWLLTRVISDKKTYNVLYEVDFSGLPGISLNKVAIIPAFGDCGYYGFAKGLISYYSSYDKKNLSKTAIHVVKIKDLIVDSPTKDKQ